MVCSCGRGGRCVRVKQAVGLCWVLERESAGRSRWCIGMDGGPGHRAEEFVRVTRARGRSDGGCCCLFLRGLPGRPGRAIGQTRAEVSTATGGICAVNISPISARPLSVDIVDAWGPVIFSRSVARPPCVRSAHRLLFGCCCCRCHHHRCC